MPHRAPLTEVFKKLSFAALFLVAACSPGLRVDSYPTEPDTDVDCEALFADAPRVVHGEDIIAVKDSNAVAWGAPAIVLRCGIQRPAALTVTAECFPNDGVDWFVEDLADGFMFTTVGRKFFISVEVPSAYQPATDALTDLSAAIKKHDPGVKPCV